MLVAADLVLTPARELAPGWVHVEGSRIAEVGAGPPPGPPDATGAVLVPGYVDTHVHGGGGASFDDGTPAAAERVVATHRAHGTTSMLASLVTLPPDELTAAVQQLAALADGGLLAGIHLEGPWLSLRHAGAHPPGLLSTPTPAAVDALVDAGGGHLRMVTLAPELPGGLAAVRRLAEAGVVAALGHTDATYDVARAALDAGAGVGTHLFNAMRPLHHREPGAVGALLEDPAAGVELVADGIHLHPAVLRLAFAQLRRPVLVTDAMAAAGAADGDYRLGELAVAVRHGVARLARGGAIAGSTLTLDAAVRYAVREAGLPLAAAVRAATATPAEVLGLTDVGVLAPGHRADLNLLDRDLHVTRTLLAGRWLAPTGVTG